MYMYMHVVVSPHLECDKMAKDMYTISRNQTLHYVSYNRFTNRSVRTCAWQLII